LAYILHRKYGVEYGDIDMRQALKAPAQNEPLILSYMDRFGKIAIAQVAQGFGMSKGQLAETAGLARETLYRTERARAGKAQGRLREMLEIISRVSDWAGGKEQAMAWYRAQPLPAFGGRTAEALVKDGKAGAVRDYLDHMAVGGFA
jgi:DNA-binding phage protein